MTEVYVLDSSAMETLNFLVTADASLFDKLDRLNDSHSILFCDTVKNECRQLFQGEKIAIWVSPVWRGIRARCAVAYSDIQGVMCIAPEILDDGQDENDAQALRTMALAHKLMSEYEVIVVSDEHETLEDRCTVIEACNKMQLKCLPVADFLARF